MSDIRDTVFRIRSYTPIPLILVLLWIAEPHPLNMAIGALCIALGELIRIWAVAHAGGATRTRNVGAPYLVTSGPYALVRNPLYLGNIIIYLGVTAFDSAAHWWLLPIVLVYFTIQYKLIISLEESTLVEIFGEKYEKYRSQVPALFPFRGRITPQEERAANWGDSLSNETSTFGSISVMVVLLLAKYWCYTTYCVR